MKALLVSTMLGCLLLAGCASGPIYRPAATPGDYGYRDTELANTRYQVSFSGGYGVARETVQNLALFRAAQVALSHDSDRFRVVARQTGDVAEHASPVATIGYGYGYGFPFWMMNVGVARTFQRTRYETVLEIRIGPQVPQSGPDIYDAHEITQHLAALARKLGAQP